MTGILGSGVAKGFVGMRVLGSSFCQGAKSPSTRLSTASILESPCLCGLLGFERPGFATQQMAEGAQKWCELLVHEAHVAGDLVVIHARQHLTLAGAGERKSIASGLLQRNAVPRTVCESKMAVGKGSLRLQCSTSRRAALRTMVIKWPCDSTRGVARLTPRHKGVDRLLAQRPYNMMRKCQVSGAGQQIALNKHTDTKRQARTL